MPYSLSAVLLTALLLVCPCPTTSKSPPHTLKIGVTAGPHADIMKKIQELAKSQCLTIEIIEFNDFILPNEALDTKDLEMNSYQHEPFLQSQVQSRGYALKVVAKTILMPLGIYSTKVKSLKDLSKGATLTIPNDPTNEGRALKLLAKLGEIEIKDMESPCVLDITSNPKDFRFIEIEAPLLPTSLKDADAAVINTDWVLTSGLDPKSAIAHEDKTSLYVNVLVVRTEDENNEDIQKVIKLYHSKEVADFITEKYKDAVIPAW